MKHGWLGLILLFGVLPGPTSCYGRPNPTQGEKGPPEAPRRDEIPAAGPGRGGKQALWIGIDRDGEGRPVYSFGPGEADPPAGPEDKEIKTQQRLLQRLDATLEKREGLTVIRVKAHPDLPQSVARDLRVELGKRRDRVGEVYLAVARPPFYRARKGPEKDTRSRPPDTPALPPVLSREQVSARRDRLILVKAWQRKGETVVSVEGKEVKEKDLTPALKRYVREGREELVIESDAETPRSVIVAILDAAREAKVKRVYRLQEKEPESSPTSLIGPGRRLVRA